MYAPGTSHRATSMRGIGRTHHRQSKQPPVREQHADRLEDRLRSSRRRAPQLERGPPRDRAQDPAALRRAPREPPRTRAAKNEAVVVRHALDRRRDDTLHPEPALRPPRQAHGRTHGGSIKITKRNLRRVARPLGMIGIEQGPIAFRRGTLTIYRLWRASHPAPTRYAGALERPALPRRGRSDEFVGIGQGGVEPGVGPGSFDAPRAMAASTRFSQSGSGREAGKPVDGEQFGVLDPDAKRGTPDVADRVRQRTGKRLGDRRFVGGSDRLERTGSDLPDRVVGRAEGQRADHLVVRPVAAQRDRRRPDPTVRIRQERAAIRLARSTSMSPSRRAPSPGRRGPRRRARLRSAPCSPASDAGRGRARDESARRSHSCIRRAASATSPPASSARSPGVGVLVISESSAIRRTRLPSEPATLRLLSLAYVPK